MITPIHDEIKQHAKRNPAAYLSIDFVQTLIIKAFVISMKNITGVEISAGQQVLSASVDSATFATPPSNSAQFVKYPNALPNQIGLALNSDLTVIIKVFIKGDRSKLISIVAIKITGLMVLGTYGNNIISFEGVDFKPSPTVTRDPLADQRLVAAGIDPMEAARVEGLIEYSAVNASIAASLAQRKELSLSELYPAFDFGNAADLIALSAGKFLAIIPSEFTRVETAACKCATGPDIPVSGSSNSITVPANPVPGTSLGSVTIGGPLPQQIDPLKDLGARYVGSGEAGVYLPKVAYEGLTAQVMPAILVYASDDGFIGFDARGTVGFSAPAATLDQQKGGIIVSFKMDISIQTVCYVNLGCGIRFPIGYAIINPVSGSNASLEMGFYPSVDQTGTVIVTAVLQKVDMGKYTAIIVSVAEGLKIIGVSAWIGFLIDVVLSAIVSNKLPSALCDAVKKYLGHNEWKLLSFGELISATYGRKLYSAPFDVDFDSVRGDTMLASIAHRQELRT